MLTGRWEWLVEYSWGWEAATTLATRMPAKSILPHENGDKLIDLMGPQTQTFTLPVPNGSPNNLFQCCHPVSLPSMYCWEHWNVDLSKKSQEVYNDSFTIVIYWIYGLWWSFNGATKTCMGSCFVGYIVVYCGLWCFFLSAAFYTVYEICELSSIPFSVLTSTSVTLLSH